MTSAMPPCIVSDSLWEHFASEGEEAWGQGKADEAERLWRTCIDLIASFKPSDPRRAASLNNLAAAKRARGDLAEAETLYRRAVEGWEKAPQWIANMAIELKARSTFFHFRLEQKHRQSFIALGRMENERLAQGGLAAAWNNLAELLHATKREGEAEALYRRARETRARALGARDLGLARIHANLAELCEAAGNEAEAAALRARTREIEADPALAGRARLRAEITPRMTDLRKLKAAVYLTPVLRRLPHRSPA